MGDPGGQKCEETVCIKHTSIGTPSTLAAEGGPASQDHILHGENLVLKDQLRKYKAAVLSQRSPNFLTTLVLPNIQAGLLP